MIRELDKRLNKIFEAYEEIRKAKLRNEHETFNRKLLDSLTDSCLLLTDILEDEILGDLPSDHVSMRNLKALYQQGKLQKFLDLERKLLEMTKLEPPVVDELIQAITLTVSTAEPPLDNWKESIDKLKGHVCDQVRNYAELLGHEPLIKRTIVAGGGALMAIINSIPNPVVPIPAPINTYSVSIGIWLIAEAGRDQIKRLFREADRV